MNGTGERYMLMLEMRESGATYMKIAKHFGISHQRVDQVINGARRGICGDFSHHTGSLRV